MELWGKSADSCQYTGLYAKFYEIPLSDLDDRTLIMLWSDIERTMFERSLGEKNLTVFFHYFPELF